jgi:hypothetical protein
MRLNRENPLFDLELLISSLLDSLYRKNGQTQIKLLQKGVETYKETSLFALSSLR